MSSFFRNVFGSSAEGDNSEASKRSRATRERQPPPPPPEKQPDPPPTKLERRSNSTMSMFDGLAMKRSAPAQESNPSLLSMLEQCSTNESKAVVAPTEESAPSSSSSAFSFLYSAPSPPIEEVVASSSVRSLQQQQKQQQQTSAPSPSDGKGSAFGFISTAQQEEAESPSNFEERSASPADAFSGISIRSRPPSPIALDADESHEQAPEQQQQRQQQQQDREEVEVPDEPERFEAEFRSHLRRVQVLFGNEMHKYWKAMKQSADEQEELHAAEEKLLASIFLVEGSIGSLEALQAEAVVQENYYQADELDSKIQLNKAELEQLCQKVKKVQEEHQRNESGESELLEFVAKNASEYVDSITELQNETSVRMKEFISTQESVLHTEESICMEEADRFERMLGIISGDLARVEDEEHEINAAIRERSSAEHEDVDRFTEKKAKVEGELEELRKAVALKEQELAQLQDSLNTARRKIEKASSSYERQLRRLQERRNRIEVERNETKREREDVICRKNSVELKRNQVDDIKQAEELLQRVAQQTIQDNVVMLEMLRAYEGSRQQALQQERELLGAFRIAASHSASTHTQHQALLSRSESLKQSLESHRSNLATINAQLPILLADKQAAVKDRKFKTAAKISNEHRTLSNSVSESQARIEVNESELVTLEKDLDLAQSSSQQSLEHKRNAETKYDRFRFEKLSERSKMLHEVLRLCSAESETELVLQLCKDADSQLQALSERYGWSDAQREPASSHEDENDDDDDDDDDDGVETLESLAQTLRLKEQELNDAIAEDDFERADVLQSVINSLEVRRDRLLPADEHLDVDAGSASITAVEPQDPSDDEQEMPCSNEQEPPSKDAQALPFNGEDLSSHDGRDSLCDDLPSNEAQEPTKNVDRLEPIDSELLSDGEQTQFNDAHVSGSDTQELVNAAQELDPNDLALHCEQDTHSTDASESCNDVQEPSNDESSSSAEHLPSNGEKELPPNVGTQQQLLPSEDDGQNLRCKDGQELSSIDDQERLSA